MYAHARSLRVRTIVHFVRVKTEQQNTYVMRVRRPVVINYTHNDKR